jgi:ubiquinone/menaquinone biosynthesis C-methylase UbiE
VNWIHRRLCRSAAWKKSLESDIVPWVLGDLRLGGEVLEVGPGPGLTTDLLRSRTERLTAIEIDPELAGKLERRMAGSGVEVLQGDATAMPFDDRTFSAAVAFTMLHHVPSPALQDRLLREVYRVLQPGGVFAGTDHVMSFAMRLVHIGDTLLTVDPRNFAARLEAAGFTGIEIQQNRKRFRFVARRA